MNSILSSVKQSLEVLRLISLVHKSTEVCCTIKVTTEIFLKFPKFNNGPQKKEWALLNLKPIVTCNNSLG